MQDLNHDQKRNFAASDFSSVHTPSTSLQITSVPTYREYLFEKKTPEYFSAAKFYSLLSQYGNDKLFDRFTKCKSNAVFARNVKSGQIKVLSSSCHLRFCPICNRTRGLMIYKNTTEWLKKTKYPKFLTLTIKHTDEPLTNQIDKIYDFFKKLRRSKYFSDRATSGIWFFQIKKSEKTNEWHPHIHCIIDGQYLSQPKLKQIWYRITKTSLIIDIRLIKDQKKAANYVSRYAVKPMDITYLDFNDQLEIHNAIANRRLCGVWGTCRKLRLTTPIKFEKDEYQIIGGWQEVLLQVNKNPMAKLVYESWLKNEPILENVRLYANDIYKPPPDDEYDTADSVKQFVFF